MHQHQLIMSPPAIGIVECVLPQDRERPLALHRPAIGHELRQRLVELPPFPAGIIAEEKVRETGFPEQGNQMLRPADSQVVARVPPVDVLSRYRAFEVVGPIVET